MRAVMRIWLVRRQVLSLLTAGAILVLGGFGQTQQPGTSEKLPGIENPAQLVGKKINVKRLPLCEPGTYKTDLVHAGMEATVLSAKPSTIPALPESALDRMSPAMREMILDQQKAVLLLLRFEDGTERDTCAPIGPKKLAEYLEIRQEEASNPNASNQPVALPDEEDSKSPGGRWVVEPNRDKLTDIVSDQFNLMADDKLHDSTVTTRPVLAVVCRAGQLKEAEFQTGLVLGAPAIEERGLLNIQVPVQYVRVRLDNKISQFSWEQLADSKSMRICCSTFSGKNELEKILKARDVRIEFGSFSGYAEVATFSPSGLDTEMFAKSCGIRVR
jgi:hypothetical protein